MPRNCIKSISKNLDKKKDKFIELYNKGVISAIDFGTVRIALTVIKGSVKAMYLKKGDFDLEGLAHFCETAEYVEDLENIKKERKKQELMAKISVSKEQKEKSYNKIAELKNKSREIHNNLVEHLAQKDPKIRRSYNTILSILNSIKFEQQARNDNKSIKR